MKLSTKGRYAVTAMLDLALHYKEGAVTLAEIAQRQRISLSYLEQLFAKLRRSGLVQSVRGPGGGYALAAHPSEISVADVVASINDIGEATGVVIKKNFPVDDADVTHLMWEDLSAQIYQFLRGIMLSDLVSRPSVPVASRPDGRPGIALPQ